jgi:hypothetical protein
LGKSLEEVGLVRLIHEVKKVNCKAVRVIPSEDEKFLLWRRCELRVRWRGVVSSLVAVQRILDKQIKLTSNSAIVIAMNGTLERK